MWRYVGDNIMWSCILVIHESCYNERQKKLITYVERHSLKATASKWLYHIWIQIRYSQIVVACVKEEKMQWNRKKSVLKNRRNCSLSELHKRLSFQIIQYYLSNFNGGLYNRLTGFCLWHTQPGRRAVSVSFKNYLMRFHGIFAFST